MFDISQVKQSVGKWSKQDEAGDADTGQTTASRPTPSRAISPGGSRDAATIGSSIRISGDLTGDEDLNIDGNVEGTINLEKNSLTIGTNGRIKANIQAKSVIVEGELRGDIVAKEKVVIRKTGNMRGNIVAPRVTLEDGAMFKGSIEMEPEVQRGAEPDTVATLSRTPGAEANQDKVKGGKA